MHSSESLPRSTRQVPGSRRSRIVAAACVAGIAAAGVGFLTDSGSEGISSPDVAPVVVGGDDLSRYDGTLLHHHGIKVPAPETTVEPTAAQRLAAERFHHR